MAIVTKRTIMSLYSDADDIYCHQVRIVLAEKGVNYEVLSAKQGEPSSELLAHNPYGTLPALLDRDLVLYDAKIIMEYLDERFPHPPLLPVYPVARAETRKMIFRVEHDWYTLVHQMMNNDQVDEARETLSSSLLNLEPLFADKPYFMSDEFSLLDCVVAPLLWRLPKFGINIPAHAKGLTQYMQRVFNRDSFKSSLTDAERQIRAA